jgi:FtsZ-binding cell division protein ZapB
MESMNIEESFDHLEAKICQAIETINRLREERKRIGEENRKLKNLLEKRDQEMEARRAKDGEIRQRIEDNRYLTENREQIVSRIRNMLDKLDHAARP